MKFMFEKDAWTKKLFNHAFGPGKFWHSGLQEYRQERYFKERNSFLVSLCHQINSGKILSRKQKAMANFIMEEIGLPKGKQL